MRPVSREQFGPVPRTFGEALTEFPRVMLRTMAETDVPYIVDSWVQSYRGQARAREVGAGYRRSHKALVRNLLKRATCVVACLEDDADTIVGYAVTEPGCVHYVLVRDGFTRNGLAKTMIAPFLSRDGVRYSHKTSMPITIPAAWVYDPYAAH